MSNSTQKEEQQEENAEFCSLTTCTSPTPQAHTQELANLLQDLPPPSPMLSDDVPRIFPLSEEAIARITSSKHITSLQSVILSLLENSLDAGASRVSISVDWKRGGCTVDDNGHGIAATEFAENGGLARMYCTSKRPSVDVRPTAHAALHGSTGTFLAELGAISLLYITSKHTGSNRSSSLTMHLGSVIARRLSDSSVVGLADTHSASGTTVTVRDLFGNMPVRVKQRTLITEDALENDRVWRNLKHGVAALLMAWPNPCSVRIQDDALPERALSMSGQHPDASGSLTAKHLQRLSGKPIKYDLRDTLPIIFQAGLAPPESKRRWIPLSASTSGVSLKGLICLDPAPTKFCQFVAIGIHPCVYENGYSELHEAINNIFLRSSFGVVDENAEDHAASSNELAIGRHEVAGNVAKPPKARRNVERYPMYIMQLDFVARPATSGTELDPMHHSTIGALSDILEAGVAAWLEKNHFRPHRLRKRRRDRQQTSDATSPSVRHLFGHGRSDLSLRVPLKSNIGQSVSVVNRTAFADLNVWPVQPLRSGSTSDTATFRSLLPEAADLSRIRIGSVPNMLSDTAQSKHVNELADSDDGSKSLQFLEPPQSVTSDTLTMPLRENKSGDTWSPISGNRTNVDYNASAIDSEVTTLERRPTPQKPPVHGSDAATSDDFGGVEEADLLAAEASVFGRYADSGQSREDHNMVWTDPVTKQRFQVNSRTGVVQPSFRHSKPASTNSHDASESREQAGIDSTLSSAGKPLRLARRSAATTQSAASGCGNDAAWLPRFLSDWNNPVFVNQQEEPIRAASLRDPGVIEEVTAGRCYSHSFVTRPVSTSGGPGMRLSKAGLRRARVVGQVDQKFILCQMPAEQDVDSTRGGTDSFTDVLVLVDQHAASERVILEALLNLLCVESSVSGEAETVAPAVKVTSLGKEDNRSKSLRFEISAHEFESFARFETHFRTWGLVYTLASQNVEDRRQVHLLSVTHLPTVVAERCVNLPALCIDMLRTEVWHLADGTRRPLSSLPSRSNDLEDETLPYWIMLLPLMPAHLLSMLHSRACRSAIMFNDPLTKRECEELVVEKLSRCVFPFVCAHGRVGMVPLGDLGGDGQLDLVANRLDSVKSGARDGSAAQREDSERGCICRSDDFLRWMHSK